MVAIGKIVRQLYPDAEDFMDYQLATNEDGYYFHYWNEEKLGPEPEMKVLEDEAVAAKVLKQEKKEDLAKETKSQLRGVFLSGGHERDEVLALVIEALRLGTYDERLDVLLNLFGNLQSKNKQVDAIDENDAAALRKIEEVTLD